ncbi:MAG: ribonuclease P protein component [Oscillospiraceae bacterium]|nr:ribonuclease P protein component [Oscillospiraceae bacterium]
MKIEKIKKNKEFRFIYRNGNSINDENLVVYIFKRTDGHNKLGISVSKKVGKSVTRNRVRRLIYESYRNILKERTALKNGYSLIFIARSKSSKCTFIEIKQSVLHLLVKVGFLKEDFLIDENNAH